MSATSPTRPAARAKLGFMTPATLLGMIVGVGVEDAADGAV